jgi:hypothetical protein
MVAAGVQGLAQRTYNLGSAPTDASGFHLVVQCHSERWSERLIRC